ncbi:hypothetical protein K458DRAFT_394258 [Lentithecium fluviatile CBS 122367]|uniref:Uncharacterized protein n=1 Tax=Lentithecium fluviatile CBS 122367 TaxID=1168545 RepID=A0A6G1ILL5_9PLEO|nr:hypothetical protein K458DRAFT_394258 [Lentithecium fluviatile CBS 122367]
MLAAPLAKRHAIASPRNPKIVLPAISLVPGAQLATLAATAPQHRAFGTHWATGSPASGRSLDTLPKARLSLAAPAPRFCPRKPYPLVFKTSRPADGVDGVPLLASVDEFARVSGSAHSVPWGPASAQGLEHLVWKTLWLDGLGSDEGLLRARVVALRGGRTASDAPRCSLIPYDAGTDTSPVRTASSTTRRIATRQNKRFRGSEIQDANTATWSPS